MEKRNFHKLLQARLAKGFHVCVGLDVDYNHPKFPEIVKKEYNPPLQAVSVFCRSIIHSTHNDVAAYKPNFAFYVSYGADGISLLREIVAYIKKWSPEIPIILDAKWADIGNTNNGYVETAFDYLDVDAVTLNPYLGKFALQPFLDHKEKGFFVLCRTSNEGAGEFQNQLDINEKELYKKVAENVHGFWNENGNCGLVVGATVPRELQEVTNIIKGEMPILIPGVGEQGGELEGSVKAATYDGKMNAIINVSRSAIFASSGEDYPLAAAGEVKRLNSEIHKILKKEEER